MSLKHARAEPKIRWKCTLTDCPLCQQVTFMGINYCCDQKNTKSPRCIYVTTSIVCDDTAVPNVLCADPITGALGREAINSMCVNGFGCSYGTYTGNDCFNRFGTYKGCPNP
jgi:hypothetical protein